MTRYLFTLDPGVKAAGVAVFDLDTKALAGAALARGKKSDETVRAALHFVMEFEVFPSEIRVEVPQVYVKGKGDPNDLIDITYVAGQFSGAFISADDIVISCVRPRAWKGQVNPDAMIERIKGRLSPEEMMRVEIPRAKSLAHNIFDAVGIGLHRLGRL